MLFNDVSDTVGVEDTNLTYRDVVSLFNDVNDTVGVEDTNLTYRDVVSLLLKKKLMK